MDDILKDNDLLFLSGNDLPFPAVGVNIRQPKIKEIALLGEQNFYIALELLNFSKESLSEEDKVHLEGMTNFEVLIAILEEPNAVMRKNRNCVMMVLSLIFPDYEIKITKEAIELANQDNDIFKINKNNFDTFKSIINRMFEYKQDESIQYNPAGQLSKRIAEKLRKRHEKLQEIKPAQKIDILSRYISILATGQNMDINRLLDYTIYQLFDIFKRWQLREAFQINIQAKLAGAKDLKEAEDWMKDIHSDIKY